MKNGSIFKNEDVRGNNKTYSYGVKKENNDVKKQINNLFRKSKNKINIRIYLDNKVIEDRIIAKTEDYILTLNNNKIDIKSILKVEEI